jgi:hypothetical protein
MPSGHVERADIKEEKIEEYRRFSIAVFIQTIYVSLLIINGRKTLSSGMLSRRYQL